MKVMHAFFDFFRNQHDKFYKVFLAVLVGLAIIWMYPNQISFKYEFYLGSPWQNEDLLAPFDFAILKTENELAKEKDEIKASIVPIYKKYDEIGDTVLIHFESYWKREVSKLFGDSVSGSQIETVHDYLRQNIQLVNAKGIIRVDEDEGRPANDEYIFLVNSSGSADHLVTDFYTLKQAITAIVSQSVDSTLLSENQIIGLIANILDYNVLFENELTQLLVADELKSISPYRGKIEKGTMLIQRGEIVDDKKNQILLSFEKQYQNKLGDTGDLWWLLIGEILSTAVIFWLIYHYLNRYNRKLSIRPNGWFFILLFFLLAVIMYRYGVYVYHFDPFLMPIFIIPIIVRAFFDVRLAMVVHLLIVLMVSVFVPNPYEFIIVQILAGFIVLFTLRGLRKRSQFFITTLIIFLSYSLVYFSIAIYSAGHIREVDGWQFAIFAGNAILSLISYPLIYLFEKLFGYLSELTLIEMTDMNNRLLRDLAEKAPGTFQHSMQVANLSGAAIREIGGNELLVRVGAMYHDIGKINNPTYFIENQNQGYNPHDELSYEESAKIIINHVLDGIDLAKKNNLPDVITDFIRTHHGLTRVEFFYRMQMKEQAGEKVDPAVYTYPGPKPYSKETAVLMMADGVEAASRSLKNYSTESIEKLVDAIIDNHINSGQFEFADINFKAISKIKKIFKNMLLNIYHVRMEYPEA